MDVNRNAPVIGTGEIEIAAPQQVVWDVLTDFESWPSWNSDVKSIAVQGDPVPGTVFRWKAGPGTITSTIQQVDPPRLIAWTGTTFGVRARHVYRFEPRDGTTLVSTDESFEGLLARLLRGSFQKTLDRGLSDGLRCLKAESERRSSA